MTRAAFIMALVAATAPAAVFANAPLWDILPGISQLKSGVQWLAGDTAGAVATQQNFFHEGLGTSQALSVYYLATGDPARAWDVQKKFARNAEVWIDSTPLLGHAKGLVHMMTGEAAHGWLAWKMATSSAGAVVGAMAAGPPGAVAGHLLADALITTVDKVANGADTEPHGLIKYVSTVGTRSTGEHFDAVAGIVMNGVGGTAKPTVADVETAAVLADKTADYMQRGSI